MCCGHRCKPIILILENIFMEVERKKSKDIWMQRKDTYMCLVETI